jgi:type II secretory pathway component PulF
VPDFTYQALTPNGSVTTGRMTADDEHGLEATLRRRGEFLISAEPLSDAQRAERAEAAGAAERERRKRTDGSVSRKELLAFTEYLWGSAQAGIPILTTLGDLEAQVDSKRMKRIVAEVRDAMVVEGKSLSEALAEHPRAFPLLYIGTIEAGETTGQLDYALQQLVEYLEWHQEITLQIRQATLYPVIVLSVMAVLVVLLLTYVYPKLLPIFTGFGIELPLATRVVLSSGEFLDHYWMWLLGGALGTPLLLRLIAQTARGRLWLDTLKLKLPVFGPLLHQLEMARLVTYMALFYRTGVDLIRAFALLETMMTNRRVALAVGQAREAISGGDSIAQSLARTGLFPSVVIRSFALGESTGKLDDSLERARVYYAREVPAAVRRMLASLQPLLIVVLGVILGMIAMSIFMPIMSIYQSIGR